MAYDPLFLGTTENDDTGDKPRVFGAKLNTMLTELYAGQAGVWSITDPYYGADPTGEAECAAEIQGALDDAETAGGGSVRGHGKFKVASMLTIPNRVRFEGTSEGGTGTGGSQIVAANNFSGDFVVRNKDIDGTQEFAYFRHWQVNANKGGGASVAVAAVGCLSLFVNSAYRDLVIVGSPSVGLLVRAMNAMGPLLFENIWVLQSDGHGILVDEDAGNTASVAGLRFKSISSEHQATGKAAFRVAGLGHIIGLDLDGLHVEMVNTGAGTRGLVLDGVGHVRGRLIQLQAGAAGSIVGVEITNSAYNVDIALDAITNINLINPVLADAKNGVTYGAVNVPWYRTPDCGLSMPGGEQTLTYGASVATNRALGDFCLLAVTDANAFQIENPTNLPVGETVTYEITNATGGAIATPTWGTDFAYKAVTMPATGKRMTVTFKKRSAANLAQVGAQTPDM